MIEKSLTVPIEKAAPQSDADGVWIISTKNPDRDGDTIAPAALRAMVGKVVPALFEHLKGQIVGFWRITHEKAGELYAELKLASTDVGVMARTLIEEGVPLSASIRFMGAGKKNKRGGTDFDRIDILEASLVAIPANAEAVRVKAFSLGLNPEALFDVPARGRPLTPAQQTKLHSAAAAIDKANQLTKLRRQP